PASHSRPVEAGTHGEAVTAQADVFEVDGTAAREMCEPFPAQERRTGRNVKHRSGFRVGVQRFDVDIGKSEALPGGLLDEREDVTPGKVAIEPRCADVER